MSRGREPTLDVRIARLLDAIAKALAAEDIAAVERAIAVHTHTLVRALTRLSSGGGNLAPTTGTEGTPVRSFLAARGRGRTPLPGPRRQRR